MKREAPAATRNLAPIVELLVPLLAERSGDVLEIGSGTGQHALGLASALPKLRWWPTDPDPAQRASIQGWRDESGPENLAAPFALDAARAEWGLGMPGAPPARLVAIWCANVIHISPWSVAEGLFAGAGRHLQAGGKMLLYGPFRHGGSFGADSNARFDADLRARDPRWGVRDVEALDLLAEAAQMRRSDMIEMPANNHVLVFEQRGGD